MARTIKKGLDYFPFDVDFFQDIKIRKLIKYQGGKAVTVYALLLCNIYRNGYYAEWDKELPFIISEQSGYTEAYIQEVIDCCLNIGLLSKELFESEKVLTSKGIQERYRRICTSNRKRTKISEYNLLPPGEEELEAPAPQTPAKEKKSPSAPKKESRSKPAAPTPPTPQPTPETPPPAPIQPYAVPVKVEVDAMKQDEAWKESVCIRYNLSDEAILKYFDDFALNCDKQHTSLQDAKSHFCRWLNIQIAQTTTKVGNAIRQGIIEQQTKEREEAYDKMKKDAVKPADYIRSYGYDPAIVTMRQAGDPEWRAKNPPTMPPQRKN